MNIILSREDPIIRRARMLKTETFTEIGFIPGDENGCKVYGRRAKNNKIVLIGLHSKIYGCKKTDERIRVIVETEKLGDGKSEAKAV